MSRSRPCKLTDVHPTRVLTKLKVTGVNLRRQFHTDRAMAGCSTRTQKRGEMFPRIPGDFRRARTRAPVSREAAMGAWGLGGQQLHKRLNKDEQLKEKRSSFRRGGWEGSIAVNLRQMFLSGLGFRGLLHCIAGRVARIIMPPFSQAFTTETGHSPVKERAQRETQWKRKTDPKKNGEMIFHFKFPPHPPEPIHGLLLVFLCALCGEPLHGRKNANKAY